MVKKIAIIYGGKSPEHKVSLVTAKSVITALLSDDYHIYPIYIDPKGHWFEGNQVLSAPTSVEDLKFHENIFSLVDLQPTLFGINKEPKFDIVFPLLHGPNGEDGTIQGLFEMLQVPYVGNRVLASATGMDKVLMKTIFGANGIPQVKYLHYLRYEWEEKREDILESIETELGYPCFVKPANLGSSVGITKATSKDELRQSIEEAFRYDRKIIVEEGLAVREIEIALLGNDTVECSVIGEIIPKRGVYDYESKYETNDTGLVIPAEIPSSIAEELRVIAKRAFKALDCSGLVRADFFLTKDNQLYLNEVNTLPGFTPVSMYPLLWLESGLTYRELIIQLIELGIQSSNERKSIQTNF